jgi:hypothetical protein
MSSPDPGPERPPDTTDQEQDLPPIGAGLDLSDPNSPLAPYYLRVGHVPAVLILATVFFICSLLPIWHTDIWGHLQFGRWMAENRRLPDHEPFSPFSEARARYVNFQWLAQAGLYLAYHLGEILAGGDWMRRMEGGAEMLRTAHLALVVLRFAVMLLAFRRLTRSMPLASASTAVLLVLTVGHLVVLRPQLIGELFFAGLLLALSRPLLSVRALLLLPVVMVVWANAHGSYLIGLGLLAVCLAGRWIEAWRAGTSRNPLAALKDAQVRRLLAVLILSAGAIALLNPHGPFLYLHTLALARNPNVATLEEWQPLDFSAAFGGHWGYLAALVLLVATQALSPRAFSPTQVLLMLTFGVVPCFQQRMMIWWLMLVPWLMVPLWAAASERLPANWRALRSVPSFRKTLLAALLVVVVLPWSPPVRWLIAGRPRPLDQSVSRGTPWKLAAELTASPGAGEWLPALHRELQEHYPGGRYTGRIFASETQGDYLVWALPAEFPVLAYTHVHLFPPEHWQACMTVKSAEPGWWEVLDRYRVNLVIVEPDLHPDLAGRLRLDPGWVIVQDEGGDRAKPDPRTRLLIALRKRPRLPPP